MVLIKEPFSYIRLHMDEDCGSARSCADDEYYIVI